MPDAPGPAIALIHSPLTSAAAWGTMPDALRTRGWHVTVTEVHDDEEPPYTSRFVARTAQQLHLAEPDAHLWLIGHDAAGPLLPQIAFARHSAGAPVRGYVFIDAMLPRTLRTNTLLDVMETQDPVASAHLAQLLSDGGRYPDWADRDLIATVPNVTDRAVLLSSLRPRGLDFFTEALPLPEDWPDAPCHYLRLSDAFDPEARTAELRGWPVARVDAHHFWPLTDPEPSADAIAELLTS